MKDNKGNQDDKTTINKSNISYIGDATPKKKEKNDLKKSKIADESSLSVSKYQDQDDMISADSEEDVEAKVQRLIQIQKAGGNYKEYLENKERDSLNEEKKKQKKNFFAQQKTKEEIHYDTNGHLVVSHANNEESKLNNKSSSLIQDKDFGNSRELSFIEVKNVRKILSKKKKLELLNRRQKEYLLLVDNQKKRREEEMKILEEQINKQDRKFIKLQEGESVSDTESFREELNPTTRIENSVALLNFIFRNNIAFKKLYFLERFTLIYSNNLNNTSQNDKSKLDKSQNAIEKSRTFVRTGKNGEEEEEKHHTNYNGEEYEEEEDPNDDTFIHVDPFDNLEKPINKSQLVEYDMFYKEQFFKNEVFKYDVDNIQDKEENEINKEMHKLDVKRRLTEKKKLREVNALKGLDVTQLDEEIATITKEYEKIKKVEEPKVELEMNNTEKFLYKGRILGCYFDEEGQRDFPRFALKGEKEVGAEEIIDFKILRREEVARRYFDYCCCLVYRKKFNKALVYARYNCRFFVDNWIFDNLSLLVIVGNTIIILVSDPTDNNNLGNTTDNYFLYFYTCECILKIIAFTFVSAEDAYIKDYWNILDFFVVVVGWILFLVEKILNGTKISGLAGLRAFRILRPLKTIKRLKGLKKLVTALLSSLGHLGETGIILFFFFLIFAIGGRQMWQGLFYRRCMNINYGYLYSTYKDIQMCSFDTDCNDLATYGMRYICAKGYRNPDMGALNFDNVLTGFVTVFVMATLEGWSDIFTYVSKTFKDKIYINPIIVFLYFHFFIFLANFYLLKLFLAVTNAEYEHIEVSRRELTEKKSFFKLIQSKYDLKEKEKQEKKEREKQLKINNSKKSDEALRDLYYKVNDDAFHINKNRRNIPILYSTVKDMYIMTNNNPEEIYLQSKRIDEEETLLCKDIKRQQKEIDILIDEKILEMKRNKDKLNNGKEEGEGENYKLKEMNTIGSKNIGKSFKKVVPNKSSVKVNKVEEIPIEIERHMKNFNNELIDLSIDNTQKYIKEQMITLTKNVKQTQESKDNLRKKIEKKELEKLVNNQIIMFEDLPYEKQIKLEIEKKKKEEEDKKRKEDLEARAKLQKKAEEKKKENINLNGSETKEKLSNKDDDNRYKPLNESLSCIGDLSLSSMSEEYDDDKYSQNNVYIKNNEEFDEENKNEYSLNIDNTQQSLISNDDILLQEKLITLNAKDNLISKVKFNKPSSILGDVVKLQKNKEIQEKLQRMRKRFNLNNYLNKEEVKGVNVNSLGRRKSFLKFLEYTQKPGNLEEYIINEKDGKNDIGKIIQKTEKEIKKSEKNIIEKLESKEIKNNCSFLSKDSHLTTGNNNISLDDINILPDSLIENNIYIPSDLNQENIIKNTEANKLTQLIRCSVFDRGSVNTNIDLTSKEQSKYYRRMNNNLNKNLFCDLREPRGRNVDALDISHIGAEKNYEDFLQNKEELLEAANEADQNINNQVTVNIIEKVTKKIDVNKTNINTVKPDENKAGIPNTTTTANIKDMKNHGKNSKKGGFYIFKAKSIEKNKEKYPVANTNDFLVREENKVYTDPLTLKQESIPDNLRGKKYYMNYLYNILDKDLQVKDTFKVDHWVGEILGKKDKYFKKTPIPERYEAFYVFNEKKLNLLRYTYTYHKDREFEDNECSYITHNLKYLPVNVMQIVPLRLRDFGKFYVGREVNPGTLGKSSTSMNHMNFGGKAQFRATNPRSGRTYSNTLRNKSNILLGSSFSNHYKTQEEIKIKKALTERIYKKIEEFNYRTMSHYFLNEQELYFKFCDDKKRDEKISEIEETNRGKQGRMEVKKEITNINVFDIKTNSRRYLQWSGADVLAHIDEDERRKKWNNIIEALENFNIIIWSENSAIRNIQKLRYAFYVLANNDIFDILVLFIVVVNSVFMAIDGNILKPETLSDLNISNYVFNAVFMLEYVVKFIGLGPILYYSDAFTYLDTFIIAFACVDMASPSSDDTDTLNSKKNLSSSLSFLRVFRIFRVVRLTKILRRLKSMRLIIVSIKKAFLNVSYIIAIILMFILIFVLLGMSLLSGNSHYQSFLESFYTTYQLLTLEGWNSLLIEMWAMNYLCFFYFLAWIVLGNFVLFNLFISVLLQSFGEGGDDDDDDDLNEDEKIEKMFGLPDYLFNIKQSLKNKKILERVQRKRQGNDANVILENSDTDTGFINTKSALAASSMNKSTKQNTSNFSESSEEQEESSNSDENEENNEQNDNLKVLTGIEKNIKEWQRVNKLFKRNECENSFYILSQTNKFRIFCMKLIINKWFDRVILIIILLSTARLILDTFLTGYTFVFTFEIVDAVFNIIFFFEALSKICAMGFALDEGSYLRDNWNKIDIIIVFCSIFDFQNLFTKYLGGGASSSSLQFLKVLRLLRTLRPLRFISHNIQLKLIITSLFDSIGPIFTALAIVLVVYYMFSIVGISLFYTSLHNCYVMKSDNNFDLAIESFQNNLFDYEVNNDMSSISNFCSNKYNGIMDTGPAFKFSNIVQSIITSYVLSTQEGWPEIMETYRIYSDYYGIFFLVYNLAVSYFVLNLFTGIMFRYFNEAYQKETKLAEDDKKAPKYYDFLNQIYLADSAYSVWSHPNKGTIRYYLREFADSTFLDNFIMIIIGLNMISMAVNYESCPPWWDTTLVIANYIFTGIFIGECALKLLAFGPFGYFYSGWNKFDFFVVFASIVDLVVANMDGIDAAFLKSFQIIRVLRVLRVTRVLRLVKSLKGLEKLIQTLSWSMGALENVILLMVIIFSIFSILGVYFYDDIIYEQYKSKFTIINEYYNLDNFYTSFLLVFRCATGEKWHKIMMELAFVDLDVVIEAYAYIFMIISNFVTHIIMINLFLMVTLQQYDEFTGKKYNPIEKFESFLADFNNAWNKYSTPKDKGFRIKKVLVTHFFMDFNWKKLNFPEQGKLEHVKKYVSELKLRTDAEDNVYYHDVIYKILFRQMGSQVDRTNPDNALILKTEKKVQEEVKSIINSYIGSHQKEKNGQKNLLITFNPLTSHLYFKISYFYFKTFINYYKENSELMRHLEEEPAMEEVEIENKEEEEKNKKEGILEEESLIN